MPVQSSSIPTVTIPSITFKELIDNNRELKERYKEAVTELKVMRQHRKILEDKEIVLENKCTELESEKTEKETLIQLIDENLQSSKRVLQGVCTIAGAILGGGFVLVCPASAGVAIALAGTGPAMVGVALAGAAGGCLVAPVVHEKTNHALIQQVKNFKMKKEAEVNQTSKLSGNN